MKIKKMSRIPLYWIKMKLQHYSRNELKSNYITFDPSYNL